MTPNETHVPPPLRGREEGTWAQSTIRDRLPDILERTRVENDFPPRVENRLHRLRKNIPGGAIRQLENQRAPDIERWQSYIAPYQGQNWLEVPWFFAEHYFYRRIMEAVNYFDGGPDPFQIQKGKGIRQAVPRVRPLAAQINGWIQEGNRSTAHIQRLLYHDLWGNQADLSLWPADGEESPHHSQLDEAQDHLLVDDSQSAVSALRSGKVDKLDFLIDNVGFELVHDLALAAYLLSVGHVQYVCFHVKAHPTFVSDAVLSDVTDTIRSMHYSDQEPVSLLGRRLADHMIEGRLTFQDHFFWNSPLEFWHLPQDVHDLLGEADLLISKGDANYRRLVGDRHWSTHTPFPEVVDYLPVPVLALRTLKAEVAVGLPPETVARTDELDPHWMVNGRWGVIQYAPVYGRTGDQ